MNHREQRRQTSSKYYNSHKDECKLRSKKLCQSKTLYNTQGDTTICYFGNTKCLIDTEDLERVQTMGWFDYSNYIRSYDLKQSLHRFIMNCYDCNLVVHHINKNTMDNRKSNLMILTRSQHSSIHNNYIKKIGRFLTREEIQNILLSEESNECKN